MRASLPELALRRPIGTLAIVAALTVAGALAFARLPVNLMPDIAYPMVRVQVSAGQTPPEVLLQTVTRVLEQELSQAEGVELIESATQQGQVQITLSFHSLQDIDVALRDAATLVDRAKSQLPEDIDAPVLFKFDPQNLPVVEFTLSSTTLDPVDVRQFAEHDLAYRFVGAAGVASLRAAGGRVREVQVRVDPLKLRGYGLTLDDCIAALKSSNVQRPAGRVDAAGRELAGQVLSLFGDAHDIAELRVALPNGDQVRLRDVATVLDTYREQRLIVRVNGEEAVKLSVFKSPAANATEVAEAVRARLAELRSQAVIPADVQVDVTADESIYIRDSIASAQHTLLLALALVALVILLFLREWKFTLVSLAVLPVGLCLTALAMQSFGLSLNLMSIGGLILGVTLMVDYGVVLLENMTRHWAGGAGLQDAVALASKEVAGALVASLAALLAAVTPFLFLGGAAPLFFKEFILTIIFASVAGLLAAFAVIPALWPQVSRFVSHEGIEAGDFMHRLTARYQGLLDQCCGRARWFAAGAALAVLLALWMVSTLGYLFLPEIDDGRVTLTVQGEPGMLLDEFREHVEQVEALALAQKEVELVDVSTGGRIGQSVQEIPAFGEMLIQLVPKAARSASVNDWIAGFDKKVQSLDLVGVKVRARKARIRAIRTFSGQAATGDFDVVVNIQGQDATTLARLGDEVRERLRSIDGLADLTSTLILNQPLVSFAIDRDRAAAYYVAPTAAADAILAAIDGTVPSRLLDAGFYYDIRVLNDRQTLHGHLHDLPMLPLHRLQNGDMLLLGQIAELRFTNGPLTIHRANQSTVNMVNGTVRGRTLGEVADDVRTALQQMTLPGGYSLSYGGRMAALAEGGSGFGWIVLLALGLIVVVLAVQYESLANPLLIVGVLPLGPIGAIATLWLTRTPLSSTVFIGMILLIGIAANNAIVLVAYIEQLRRRGVPLAEAVRQGASARLRPKLMTAFVAMAGLAPLASGTQEAGEILQPLALAVIGGMPISLIATLLVLPTAYRLVHARLQTWSGQEAESSTSDVVRDPGRN